MTDRSPKELIDYFAFTIENDGISHIVMGDNELARLVMDWRKKEATIAAIPVIDGYLLDNPSPPNKKLKDLIKHD